MAIYNRTFFENRNKSINHSDLDFLISKGFMKVPFDDRIGRLNPAKIQTTKSPSRWPVWARVLWYQGSGSAARKALVAAAKAGRLTPRP